LRGRRLAAVGDGPARATAGKHQEKKEVKDIKEVKDDRAT
jgi:hypothetical protein